MHCELGFVLWTSFRKAWRIRLPIGEQAQSLCLIECKSGVRSYKIVDGDSDLGCDVTEHAQLVIKDCAGEGDFGREGEDLHLGDESVDGGRHGCIGTRELMLRLIE